MLGPRHGAARGDRQLPGGSQGRDGGLRGSQPFRHRREPRHADARAAARRQPEEACSTCRSISSTPATRRSAIGSRSRPAAGTPMSFARMMPRPVAAGRRAGPGAGWRSLAGATSLRPREHGEPVSTESSLHGLDAATVHEAYGRRGALPSEIKPVDAGFTVCAPAFTVDCPAGDNLWIHHAVYAAQPHDILVVHTRGEREAELLGRDPQPRRDRPRALRPRDRRRSARRRATGRDGTPGVRRERLHRRDREGPRCRRSPRRGDRPREDGGADRRHRHRRS